MKEELADKKTKDALLKSAVGFKSSDVVEEFALDDNGELKLVKRKITTKTFPPNLFALKTLAEVSLLQNDFDGLSDEELEKEKQRLIKILQNLKEEKEEEGEE